MTAPLIQGESGAEGVELSYAFINENNKEIFNFTANEPVSWSINGGEKSLFLIDKDTGKLSFKDAPDYETKKKLNGTTLKFTTNYSTQNVDESFYVEIYNNQNENNQSTPITANNFLKYVNDASYNQTLIHRLVPNFVIQGGGYTWPVKAGDFPLKVKSKGEIINEPFNSNLMGTIAMAKIPELPNSATSEWFINLSNNLNLDSQNEGFSVFGHLLGDSIQNPLLLNDQLTYNVNYNDIGLNIPELPLVNLEGNVINETNYLAIHTITTIDQRPSEIDNKFNVVVTAQDSDGNQANQYVIVNVKDIQGEVLIGTYGDDTLKGGLGNDTFQGNSGNDTIDGGADYDIATYSGNFSDYTFDISNKIVTVTDNRLSTYVIVNEGTDTLHNVEKLSFADKNALITSKEVKPIYSIGFQSEKVYSGNSDTYKFYDLGGDKYGVGFDTGIDELTGESILKFDDKTINLKNDIKATFDQVTGLNTASGKMFRLYNASFKRLPDPDGLRYWIDNFSSGKDDERAVASSFLASTEFKQLYGANVSNESYVNNLYVNVLGRDYDQEGYTYWLGNLNNGVETRYELLLGFSESLENKALFSEITGFY